MIHVMQSSSEHFNTKIHNINENQLFIIGMNTLDWGNEYAFIIFMNQVLSPGTKFYCANEKNH